MQTNNTKRDELLPVFYFHSYCTVLSSKTELSIFWTRSCSHCFFALDRLSTLCGLNLPLSSKMM